MNVDPYFADNGDEFDEIGERPLNSRLKTLHSTRVLNPPETTPSVPIPSNNASRSQQHTSKRQKVRRRRSQDHFAAEWENDASVHVCYVCISSFSMLKRKHHCRQCGRIICSDCSMMHRFARTGKKHRVCSYCHIKLLNGGIRDEHVIRHDVKQKLPRTSKHHESNNKVAEASNALFDTTDDVWFHDAVHEKTRHKEEDEKPSVPAVSGAYSVSSYAASSSQDLGSSNSSLSGADEDENEFVSQSKFGRVKAPILSTWDEHGAYSTNAHTSLQRHTNAIKENGGHTMPSIVNGQERGTFYTKSVDELVVDEAPGYYEAVEAATVARQTKRLTPAYTVPVPPPEHRVVRPNEPPVMAQAVLTRPQAKPRPIDPPIIPVAVDEQVDNGFTGTIKRWFGISKAKPAAMQTRQAEIPPPDVPSTSNISQPHAETQPSLATILTPQPIDVIPRPSLVCNPFQEEDSDSLIEERDVIEQRYSMSSSTENRHGKDDPIRHTIASAGYLMPSFSEPTESLTRASMGLSSTMDKRQGPSQFQQQFRESTTVNTERFGRGSEMKNRRDTFEDLFDSPPSPAPPLLSKQLPSRAWEACRPSLDVVAPISVEGDRRSNDSNKIESLDVDSVPVSKRKSNAGGKRRETNASSDNARKERVDVHDDSDNVDSDDENISTIVDKISELAGELEALKLMLRKRTSSPVRSSDVRRSRKQSIFDDSSDEEKSAKKGRRSRKPSTFDNDSGDDEKNAEKIREEQKMRKSQVIDPRTKKSETVQSIDKRKLKKKDSFADLFSDDVDLSGDDKHRVSVTSYEALFQIDDTRRLSGQESDEDMPKLQGRKGRGRERGSIRTASNHVDDSDIDEKASFVVRRTKSTRGSESMTKAHINNQVEDKKMPTRDMDEIDALFDMSNSHHDLTQYFMEDDDKNSELLQKQSKSETRQESIRSDVTSPSTSLEHVTMTTIKDSDDEFSPTLNNFRRVDKESDLVEDDNELLHNQPKGGVDQELMKNDITAPSLEHVTLTTMDDSDEEFSSTLKNLRHDKKESDVSILQNSVHQKKTQDSDEEIDIEEHATHESRRELKKFSSLYTNDEISSHLILSSHVASSSDMEEENTAIHKDNMEMKAQDVEILLPSDGAHLVDERLNRATSLDSELSLLPSKNIIGSDMAKMMMSRPHKERIEDASDDSDEDFTVSLSKLKTIRGGRSKVVSTTQHPLVSVDLQDINESSLPDTLTLTLEVFPDKESTSIFEPLSVSSFVEIGQKENGSLPQRHRPSKMMLSDTPDEIPNLVDTSSAHTNVTLEMEQEFEEDQIIDRAGSSMTFEIKPNTHIPPNHTVEEVTSPATVTDDQVMYLGRHSVGSLSSRDKDVTQLEIGNDGGHEPPFSSETYDLDWQRMQEEGKDRRKRLQVKQRQAQRDKLKKSTGSSSRSLRSGFVSSRVSLSELDVEGEVRHSSSRKNKEKSKNNKKKKSQAVDNRNDDAPTEDKIKESHTTENSNAYEIQGSTRTEL